MSEDFSIRLARNADAASIAAMSRDYVEHGLGWNWNVQRVAHSIRQRETNVAVAMVGDELAGFGIMNYRDADAHLTLFAVKPAHRRKGIGAALMEWLESTATAAGIELIWLEARVNNTQALAFYRARGYRTLDRLHRYYSGIEDAVRIGKDLAAAQPSSYLDK